jgi:hypothetical protein
MFIGYFDWTGRGTLGLYKTRPLKPVPVTLSSRVRSFIDKRRPRLIPLIRKTRDICGKSLGRRGVRHEFSAMATLQSLFLLTSMLMPMLRWHGFLGKVAIIQ